MEEENPSVRRGRKGPIEDGLRHMGYSHYVAHALKVLLKNP